VTELLIWKTKGNMSPEDAAQVIEHFLAETEQYPFEWTDFAETKQQDPVVETYRKRCDKLSPLVNRPGAMDETAVAELKSMIEEMRSLGSPEALERTQEGEQR
jgi:hypothetical protein